MNAKAEPMFSIVTASFNALEGVRETVQSVAEQGRADIEHIVVDGGSDDGTREYLEGLGDAVRWVSEADNGIGDALNKGIAMARGQWIVVLQAEDRFVDHAVLDRVARHLNEDADMVGFDVNLRGSDGSDLVLTSRPFGLLTNLKMTSPHQGLFVRKALYDKLGLFDPAFRIAMDYEFLLRAMKSGARLRNVNAPIVIMPATGVSTMTDWPSIRKRLAEDRKLQELHNPAALPRAGLAAFWSLYLPFKRIKAALAGG